MERKLVISAFFGVVLFVGAWALSGDLRGEYLRLAVGTRHTTVAKLLVWLGTNVNYATEDGTALHCAAAEGDVPMIHFLIRHGAVVDYPARFDVTPRAEAQMAKQTEAERVLISYGAKPVPTDLHLP